MQNGHRYAVHHEIAYFSVLVTRDVLEQPPEICLGTIYPLIVRFGDLQQFGKTLLQHISHRDAHLA
jgi:hypothetical protein